MRCGGFYNNHFITLPSPIVCFVWLIWLIDWLIDRWDVRTRYKRLDFPDDPDHDADTGSFKLNFTTAGCCQLITISVNNYKTSCARGDTAPVPLLPQWAPKRLTPPSRPKHSSTFPRWPLQLPDALTWRWVKRPGDLDLWLFDPESGIRVTCDVGYLYANFGLPRPLWSRLRPDVRGTRQRDRRQMSDKSIA